MRDRPEWTSVTHTSLREIVERTRRFVRDVILDIEGTFSGVAQDDRWRLALQSKAREAGVFAPHIPSELGGLDLNMVERGPVFEEAGYSLFGAMAINGASLDEGNQHLLSKFSSDEQTERYLVPLAKGEVRSAFAMTEPAPGAGSDPRAADKSRCAYGTDGVSMASNGLLREHPAPRLWL